MKSLVKLGLLTASMVCLGASLSAPVFAQLDDDLVPTARKFESPERMMLEVRIGPYQPDLGNNPAFDRLFKDDDGLLLQLELDVIAFRLEDLLYITGAGQVGWAKYKGAALDMTGAATREETQLEMFPLALLATARLDAFARQLGVPLILTGKVGYEWMHWATETGGADKASGWSLGLAYAGQLALDLDSLDKAAARVLDEEWGINHSFLFVELHGFAPNDDSLPLGDFSWCAGLGFVM